MKTSTLSEGRDRSAWSQGYQRHLLMTAVCLGESYTKCLC